MRVALLSTYRQRCGVGTYAENLVDAFGASVEIEVFAPRLIAGDAPIGAPQPPRLWGANRAFGFEAIGVVRAIRRARCELVHVNVNLSLFSSRFLFSLGALLRAMKIPLVATMHGRQGGSVGRRFKVFRLYQALRFAHVIVHNASHADELRALGHRSVHVIPHGMPPVEHRPIGQARAALGIDPNRRVLAHFGFLVPDKGVLEVLESFAMLRAKRFPDLFYWISGALYHSDASRAYFARLKGEIDRRGLSNSVHLTGEFVSHESAILAMQAADWIVLNYRTGNAQGSSGAISRAFASGRPVAVSSAPVFDDVREATHTLNGDLTVSLDELLTDGALAERTIERANAYCERASWPNVARMHVDLYRDALARRATAQP